MNAWKALLWHEQMMIVNFNGGAQLHDLSMSIRAIAFLALVLGGCARPTAAE